MTNAALAKVGRGRNKYGAQRTSCGVHMHDSKREAIRCGALQLLAKAHQIRSLRTQVNYSLAVDDVKLGSYRADFVYEEPRSGRWVAVVEDVKGVKTRTYLMKKKLMRALYGIEIRET